MFSSIGLYLEALRLISHGHYKQPVRTFILDMFDLVLDSKTLSGLRVQAETYREVPVVYKLGELEVEGGGVEEGAEPSMVVDRSPLVKKKPTGTAGQHRVMAALSPTRAEFAENSIPSIHNKWVEREKKQVNTAKCVVSGFEVA